MAVISLRQLLDHAAENDYGVPAFNINNMEQMLSIMEAAKRCDAPVIMQASRGARKYANDIVLTHLIRAAVEMYPEIPVCMHQDHGNSLETCQSAIAAEFSSVMMDGSLEEDGKTPASYEYNVAVTKSVVDSAHAVGVSVEGELGCLGSLETSINSGTLVCIRNASSYCLSRVAILGSSTWPALIWLRAREASITLR